MAMAVLMVARGVATDLEDAITTMRSVRKRVRLRTTQRRVAEAALDILRAQNQLPDQHAA
jgi:hypothetical protein